MKKYAKVISEETKACEVGLGTNTTFYQSIGMTEQDVEQSYDGNWYLSGYAPSQDLSELKAIKLTEINDTYEQKALAVKVDVPPSEVSTWYIQETEATEWSKDNTKPTPFIDGLAGSRQVDRLELINKVLAKVDAYKTYMSNLTGQRQFYEDLINKATTKEEVDKIQWNM